MKFPSFGLEESLLTEWLHLPGPSASGGSDLGIPGHKWFVTLGPISIDMGLTILETLESDEDWLS